MGEKGVLCTRSIDDYKGLYIPAFKQNDKVIDTVGAGDIFNGAFATAISNSMCDEDALFFANKAASISVTKPGAALSSPYKDEIN